MWVAIDSVDRVLNLTPTMELREVRVDSLETLAWIHAVAFVRRGISPQHLDGVPVKVDSALPEHAFSLVPTQGEAKIYFAPMALLRVY